MRKIILSFQLSLDGIVSDVDEWMSFSDDILHDALDYYNDIDAAIFGGGTYQFMSEYWSKAEISSQSQLERKFAKKLNDTNKIILSRKALDMTWRNSHLFTFNDDRSFIKLIQQLKEQNGKDMTVESGVGLWKQFLLHDLFDELMVFVHPVIVGKGEKLFDNINSKTNLRLKSERTIDRGVVRLFYEKIT